MKFQTHYNNRPKPELNAFNTEGPSLVQEQFAAECDINNIMAKYQKTGMLTHLNKHQGNYGDFSSVEDYQQSLHKLMQAQQSFDDLPSDIRNKFENDPSKLIGYLADSNNDEEAISLGLKHKVPTDPVAHSMEQALDRHEAKKPKAEKSEKS